MKFLCKFTTCLRYFWNKRAVLCVKFLFFFKFRFFSFHFILLCSFYKVFWELISFNHFIEHCFTHGVYKRFLLCDLLIITKFLLLFGKIFLFFFNLDVIIKLILFFFCSWIRIFLFFHFFVLEKLLLLLKQFLLLFCKLDLKLRLLLFPCNI